MPKIKKDKNGQTNSINQVRYGCALGAMHSVSAIPAHVLGRGPLGGPSPDRPDLQGGTVCLCGPAAVPRALSRS